MTRRSVGSARSIGEGEAMMTTDGPAWGAWTTHYDPVGQAPSMTRFDDESGLIVSLGMDRLELDLRSGQDEPFTGAIGLSGALAVGVPDEFPLLGFLLIVNGQITKTPGVEATVSCSLGHTSHAIEWPVDRPGGLQDPPPSDTGGEEALSDDEVFDRGFSVQCLMLDNRSVQRPFLRSRRCRSRWACRRAVGSRMNSRT
jgi:hypothetical protein